MSYIANIPVYDKFFTIIKKYQDKGLSFSDIACESLKQINGEIEDLTGFLRVFEREDDYLSEKLAYKGQNSREYDEYEEFCKIYGDYPTKIENAVKDRKNAIAEIKSYFYFEGLNALTRAKKEYERSGEISSTNQEKVKSVLNLSQQYIDAVSELYTLEHKPQSYMYSTRINELKKLISTLPFEKNETAFEFAEQSQNILNKIEIQPGE